jgi:hypothetical protein
MSGKEISCSPKMESFTSIGKASENRNTAANIFLTLKGNLNRKKTIPKNAYATPTWRYGINGDIEIKFI